MEAEAVDGDPLADPAARAWAVRDDRTGVIPFPWTALGHLGNTVEGDVEGPARVVT
jgi:hypothetical protein